MGSWNHTCMLTRMPVLAGEKVVSVFLAQRPGELADELRCYVHALYDPLPFLIYGKYDDYGAVDQFTGPQDDIVVNWFKEHVIEMDQGENEYHDIPVVAADLDLTKIYEIDHEGRLFTKWDYKADRRPIDHIVIKQSLFEKILDEPIIEGYAEAGYSYTKFKDLLHNIDGAVKWLKECWGPINEDGFSPTHLAARRMMWLSDIEQLISSTWRNTDVPPQCAWLRKKEWHGLPDPFRSEFVASDFERARMMLIERLKFSWLEAWMSRSRYWWQVPGNIGGQDSSTESHRLMAHYMLEECDRIDQHWD